VNLLGSIPECAEFAEILSKFLQQDKSEVKSQAVRTNGSKHRRESSFPRLVVRLAGSEFNAARKYLATLPTQGDTLILVENLDEAVAESVRLAKSTAYKR
jgi:succinyl-CoA synthetase beta subunit